MARAYHVLPLLALGAAALPALSAAADYPTRPLRLIVPFPPGGSNDLLARYFSDKLTDRLGQQVIVDNRAGANGIIGTEVASNTTPDGYTLLIISTSYTMNAAVRQLAVISITIRSPASP
jgi:tripartite-type tricarboxylate transporter receptor subunit TctC